MSQPKQTILESWPALKDDLEGLLSDTDSWVIKELKKAYEHKNWKEVLNVIGVMELIHNISHSH